MMDDCEEGPDFLFLINHPSSIINERMFPALGGIASKVLVGVAGMDDTISSLDQLRGREKAQDADFFL